MPALAETLRPARPRLGLMGLAVPIAVLLALVASFAASYQPLLLAYGLIMAIAALGFNLLLGYTGLLSFGHSAYFGVGAYSVAFMVQYLGIRSMEVYILVGLALSGVVSAVFGYVCVRHTRIFFGILTLALSQVLWSLALKLFWVTVGTDGLRVPRPPLVAGTLSFTGSGRYPRFITSYYYYGLAGLVICVTALRVIVHWPFAQRLQPT